MINSTENVTRVVIYSNTTDPVNREYEVDMYMILAISLGVLLVVPANLYVLYWLKNKNKTLIDTMILFDCVANIGGMLSMFFNFPKRIWGNPGYCMFMLVVRWFFISLNRIIPVTIAIYRNVMVCQGKETLDFVLHLKQVLSTSIGLNSEGFQVHHTHTCKVIGS